MSVSITPQKDGSFIVKAAPDGAKPGTAAAAGVSIKCKDKAEAEQAATLLKEAEAKVQQEFEKAGVNPKQVAQATPKQGEATKLDTAA